MAHGVAPARPTSGGWPWWIDPYSDNPVAIGVLFMLIILLMIGGLLLLRFLTVPADHPGAQPTPAPTVLIGALHQVIAAARS